MSERCFGLLSESQGYLLGNTVSAVMDATFLSETQQKPGCMAVKQYSAATN